MQKSEVISMLSKGGVFTKENKTYNNDLSDRYSYIKEEGLGGGKLDFSLTGIPYQCEDVSQSLFLVDGLAHNYFNFGNFYLVQKEKHLD